MAPSAAPPVALSPWAAPGSAAAAPFSEGSAATTAYPSPADASPADASPGGASPVGARPADAFPAAWAASDLLAAGDPAAGAPESRRRPGAVVLLSYALVAGVLLGAGVGYGVQAQRRPTPLPSLRVALPVYPPGASDAKSVAAAAPKPLSIDGDLSKLVISRPEGAGSWGGSPAEPSWVGVGELAEQSGDSKKAFVELNQNGFRRAAGLEWEKTGTRYRVALIQYGPDDSDRADYEADALSSDKPFAEDVLGGFRVATKESHWAESTETYYYGYAYARRGTVVMKIEVFAPQQVDAGELKDLAKKQWERLV